jgi:hypothetical protein
LAKVVTVGLGHELCDRAWQLGLLTVYALTALAVAIVSLLLKESELMIGS